MGKRTISRKDISTGGLKGTGLPEARRPAPRRPTRQPGGGGRAPALSVWDAGSPAPWNVVTLEHSTVATSSRGEGRLSGKRRARRRGRVGAPPLSASASTSTSTSTSPAPRALWPAACVLTLEFLLHSCPCASQVWSCCAARAPGTRPGPGRTRGCWATSVSCRVCSAWRSATCPAPPTSSACRGRSSRTCGRCWHTGCWRYRPDGSPLPRRPCVLGSGHPGAALLGHPGLNNNQQDAPVAQTPRPGLSLGHPSRLPP